MTKEELNQEISKEENKSDKNKNDNINERKQLLMRKRKLTENNNNNNNNDEKEVLNNHKDDINKAQNVFGKKRKLETKAAGGSKKLKISSIKAGLTKNECYCYSNEETGTPTEETPKQFTSIRIGDEDAHMLVADWRLEKFQSPIELNHDESIHHDHFEPLEFHGHWDEEGEALFTNNGKTALLTFSNRTLPVLVGGPLHDDQFIFEQLHFHWGDHDSGGCEHIFEGRGYSMEAHAVHYNKKYKDFDEAHDKHDGLAVVAFFIEATDNEDNPCFNKLAAAVQRIEKINSKTEVPSDCLTWIKEEAQCKGYYTYQGSLTTEPYTESVTWILYPTPIHVSRQQVAYFRNMKSTTCEQVNIVNNVRPVQTPPVHKKLNILFARSHRNSDS